MHEPLSERSTLGRLDAGEIPTLYRTTVSLGLCGVSYNEDVNQTSATERTRGHRKGTKIHDKNNVKGHIFKDLAHHTKEGSGNH